MSFSLNNFNTYTVDISIENFQGQQVYQTKFDNPKTFDEFIEKFCQSRDNWSITKSVFVPVRTNFKEFYKDLFLPTVVNRALKIDGIVKKSFAILFSLALDIFTLPIRFITVIPRAIYNAFQKDHPLYDFLTKQQKISETLLGDGRLILKFQEDTSFADNIFYDNLSIDDDLEYLENVDYPTLNHEELKIARDKEDIAINFFSNKYFCHPNINRKSLIPTQIALAGDEDTKIVHTETIERDIKLKVIPHASCEIKGNIAATIFRKDEEDNWIEDKKKAIQLNFFIMKCYEV